MSEDTRTRQLHTYVTRDEERMILKRMEDAGMRNLSAYLRKMALSGYVIRMDLAEIREISRLLSICSNNLNQYAKKANETGSIYEEDIDDLRTCLAGIRGDVGKLIEEIANVL